MTSLKGKGNSTTKQDLVGLARELKGSADFPPGNTSESTPLLSSVFFYNL